MWIPGQWGDESEGGSQMDAMPQWLDTGAVSHVEAPGTGVCPRARQVVGTP